MDSMKRDSVPTSRMGQADWLVAQLSRQVSREGLIRQTDLRCLDAHAHLADLEGTVEDVSKDSKTVAVKTADGTKESFVVADHAVVNTGKDVARLTAQGAKESEPVTVYHAEEAGKKSPTCSSISRA